MSVKPMIFRRHIPGVAFLVAVFCCAPASFAQRPGGGSSPPGPAAGQRSGAQGLSTASEAPVDLQVSVREPSGMPLAGNAMVKVSSERGANISAPTQDNATATFPKLLQGEYDIEVKALGYKTATEHASIIAGNTTDTVYVYLHPEDENVADGAPRAPLMTPKLQAEIDKGLARMRAKQYDAARAQFEKAAKIAPGNPDVQYLLGMVEYAQEHWDAARTKFQAALNIYPPHERSLLALGELQLRTGDAATAAQTLEKAYQLNGADWRTHLLLANAYAQQTKYEKALPHATRAAELGKEHAAPAWLLTGKILLNENKQEEALKALATVMQSFPTDPAAAEAKKLAAAVNSARRVHVAAALPPPPVAPPPPAPVRPWAPPDIDSKEYPVVQDAACSEGDLIQRTRVKMLRQLGNFERFLATEHIAHQEVDANGNAGVAREKDFNYLVFVQHPKPGLVYLDESRDGGENLASFPTSLATVGLFALAVNVFGPNFQSDLDYQCEGLGTWRNQSAWRLRFEQRKDVPSHLRTWQNSRGSYSVPMKGRIWIAANTYDVLHIETDLREPVAELQLTRDHLLIDYGPVKFDRGGTTLWLPWDAEMYLELRGKRYHHTHALRNYMLFSVDTGNTIGKPKTPPEENQP